MRTVSNIARIGQEGISVWMGREKCALGTEGMKKNLARLGRGWGKVSVTMQDSSHNTILNTVDSTLRVYFTLTMKQYKPRTADKNDTST